LTADVEIGADAMIYLTFLTGYSYRDEYRRQFVQFWIPHAQND